MNRTLKTQRDEDRFMRMALLESGKAQINYKNGLSLISPTYLYCRSEGGQQDVYDDSF